MRIGLLTLVILSSLAAAVAFDGAYEVVYRGIYGEASWSRKAVLRLPNSDSEIILERRAIHLFLAEYARTLILRESGREVLCLAAADDSGGYSRMDVYRVSKTAFYLVGSLGNDRYLLDTSKPFVARDVVGETLVAAQFVGAFDRDEHGWRFISSFECEERTISTSRVREASN